MRETVFGALESSENVTLVCPHATNCNYRGRTHCTDAWSMAHTTSHHSFLMLSSAHSRQILRRRTTIKMTADSLLLAKRKEMKHLV